MPVIDAAGSAVVILVAPFPRYVLGKCCDNESHLTNWGTAEMADELGKVASNTKAVLTAAVKLPYKIFEYEHDMAGFDFSAREGLLSPWSASDPVHLSAAAYDAVADKLLESGRPLSGRPTKRARLESVVPGQRGLVGRGHRGNIRPSAWFSGGGGRGNPGRGSQWMPSTRGFWPLSRGDRRGRSGSAPTRGMGRFVTRGRRGGGGYGRH